MTTDQRDSCRTFDERVDELALGGVDEPLRTTLLAHAASCPSCRASLDGLTAIVDQLLLAAPALEPPAGFEGRVLERLGAAANPPAVSGLAAPAARRLRATSRRRALGLLAAAATVLVLAGVAARLLDRPDTPPSGAIVNATGTRIGAVHLLDEPVDHVLVTIASPQAAPGVRHCELQRPDGTWVAVGSWEPVDIEHGVWATGIDPSLADATAMRIVTDDGTVLATASLR
ncbi:MAG: hypothetical protein AB7W59_06380 [Acidimicrobiia bacterium]